MEAHNVKYGTKVIVTDDKIKTPPASIPINKGDEIIYNIKHQAYLLCSYGSVTLDGKILEKGDAAEILDIKEFKIKANDDCEVLIIDAPKYNS